MPKTQTTLVFFAHATTVDNEAGISSGQSDAKVSPLGKIQIQNLRQAVKGQTFDAVFASDLSRAIETAKGAFDQSHQIIIDSRLREIDVGEYSGQPVAVTQTLMTKYIDQPFPGGESYKDVEARVNNWLTEIRADYSGKKIALVGHQATQLALEVICNHLTWQQAIDNDWRRINAFQFGWEYDRA